MIVLSNGELHHFKQKFNADIKVIATALAHINRYTGHVGTYSVAQHSVLVSRQLPSELALSGLLHDATEAFLGDVSAPLKRLLPEYRDIEQWYHNAIDRQFGVKTQAHSIKIVDVRMLVTEAKSFDLPLYAFPDVDPFDMTIERWSPERAREEFLHTYFHLIGKKAG